MGLVHGLGQPVKRGSGPSSRRPPAPRCGLVAADVGTGRDGLPRGQHVAERRTAGDRPRRGPPAPPPRHRPGSAPSGRPPGARPRERASVNRPTSAQRMQRRLLAEHLPQRREPRSRPGERGSSRHRPPAGPARRGRPPRALRRRRPGRHAPAGPARPAAPATRPAGRCARRPPTPARPASAGARPRRRRPGHGTRQRRRHGLQIARCALTAAARLPPRSTCAARSCSSASTRRDAARTAAEAASYSASHPAAAGSALLGLPQPRRGRLGTGTGLLEQVVGHGRGRSGGIHVLSWPTGAPCGTRGGQYHAPDVPPGPRIEAWPQARTPSVRTYQPDAKSIAGGRLSQDDLRPARQARDDLRPAGSAQLVRRDGPAPAGFAFGLDTGVAPSCIERGEQQRRRATWQPQAGSRHASMTAAYRRASCAAAASSRRARARRASPRRPGGAARPGRAAPGRRRGAAPAALRSRMAPHPLGDWCSLFEVSVRNTRIPVTRHTTICSHFAREQARCCVSRCVTHVTAWGGRTGRGALVGCRFFGLLSVSHQVTGRTAIAG